MKLWIDGDSCPRKAMDIVLKAHGRLGLQVVVVADRELPEVGTFGAEMRLVPHGSGEADNLVVEDSREGDIALTRDFLLGIRLVEKGVTVLNDRGKIWNIRELRERAEEAELMKAIRKGGIAKNSKRSYSTQDSHNFAAALDRLLNSQLIPDESLR